MKISPDEVVLWQLGFVKINSTLVMTWVLMLIMVLGSMLITRNIKKHLTISRWQSMLEIIVIAIQTQLKELGLKDTSKYLPFIGTLFLFLAIANICTIFPGYDPPTGSLSTTAALAICVFAAVPLFGISKQGFMGYLSEYIKPTYFMLPFHIISEISRTLALAIRLFGNIMSGTMILTILLSITPFIFPIIMTVLGLLTGVVQAYIFTILATVYIASATQNEENLATQTNTQV